MVSDERTQRIDKWLWYARFIKTRTSAARLVSEGKVRVNKTRITKPGHTISIDDILTFTVNRRLRVVRVLLPGNRRGPASEAQTLYEDLSPEPDARGKKSSDKEVSAHAQRAPGAGRPTKKERRDRDAWVDQET